MKKKLFHQKKREKTLNELKHNSVLSKFMKKNMDWSKWFIKQSIFCQQNASFKTLLLRSDLCDYSDAYIVVKGRIIVEGDNDGKTRNQS